MVPAPAIIGLIDDRGWLYLRGREREEINKGGMKVYPADIDGVIERFPATRDVCSFAFAEPLLGEDVGVAVVLERSRRCDVACALYEWTARHLARHQVPQRWYLVTKFRARHAARSTGRAWPSIAIA